MLLTVPMLAKYSPSCYYVLYAGWKVIGHNVSTGDVETFHTTVEKTLCTHMLHVLVVEYVVTWVIYIYIYIYISISGETVVSFRS